ncbi:MULTISPECIES: HAMP domain-containing sensor histidine kinase [Deinococcus]|uniref:histidine kinase n=2 Tax=Deinococcus TaxID=1298 RepID=F0RR86_DEIPM|nr:MULTISPECIES: ATP-binding protein [Deinococcus]ADY27795.1 integral membrane sensor signal transduction histidine kinase [Deinococcus proteolyticus MRP]MCY1703661.1 ATP-binding protein [Deinococcus sp. SL84]RTR26370.1 HAMP domain-containing histidine kinase [Deinococcus radiophilus]UFA51980.1 HAMP domain-containing protein [Deinococcus radiophilus]
MRFFPRLLLSHLLVILLAAFGIFLLAEWLAPTFYRDHVDHMTQMIATPGEAGSVLRADLEQGLRTTLTRALLASLPLAGGAALFAAWLMSRRMGRSVQLLDEGSRAIAQGDYASRLPEAGQDELSDLAHNFNVMAGTLEKVEQGRIELIGNVAHELRAPLAALQGYADAMQDGVMTSEHAARAISREVGAMDRLVRDLSLVSKVEAGKMELYSITMSPQELLEAAQERFMPFFEDKGVTLVVEVAPLPLLWADKERSLQVLANLLSNALRHTPPRGQVTVTAKTQGRAVRFMVADTGSGISGEHLPRIFERFYRADPARSRGEGGSGVGLTISRGLVEAMGGEIEVDSTPGKGSTFAFTLPLAQP